MPLSVQVTKASETQVLVMLRSANGKVASGLTRGISQAIKYLAGQIVKNYLSGQVLRRRSGGLARSVAGGYRMLAPDVGIVGVLPEAQAYAPAQEFGSKPYIIPPFEAKRGKALHFVVNGNDVLVRRITKPIRHPGLRSRSFLRRGLREELPAILRIIHREVKRELEGKGP